MPAGIDDIAVYVPRLYVDAEDFAEHRGISASKLRQGLGVSQMAMVDANQDPACLAANACLKIMQRNGLRPSDIGRLYASTESSMDESKAMNTYVIGMLEQVYGRGAFEHCGGIETKFACVSGSYSLYDNANWIRAGEAGGKRAIVVVSDIAKYDMGSSGELTQGAGAVAMLLSDSPRLLEFDARVTATSIRDEYDFYRPTGKPTPVVHGQYSNLLYLIQVRNTLEAYKKKAFETGLVALADGETILDHIDYLCVHLPYANMGKKALAYLLRHEWRGLPRWGPIVERIGMDEPAPGAGGTIESILADEKFMERDHEFNRLFVRTDEYREAYDSKLASSLRAATMVGNIYTASLYLSFRSALEFEHNRGADLEGKRFGFGSYGSGSSAMVFSGVIAPGYREVVEPMNIAAEMGERRRLTFDEYESIHENRIEPRDAILDAQREFVLVDVKTAPESQGERRYVYAE